MSDSDQKIEIANIATSVLSDKKPVVMALTSTAAEMLEKSGHESAGANAPLLYALQSAAGAAKKAPRLAFDVNPAPSDVYLGLFRAKKGLLPDDILKQIRIQDHLIAAILRARSNMFSLFGHIRKDRFDIGTEIAIKPEFKKVLTPEQFEKITQRIKQFEQILLNCGHTEGIERQKQLSFSEYLGVQIYNGLTFGRFGTEIVRDRGRDTNEDGSYPFHRFRPVDIATIYPVVRKGEHIGNGLRQQAIKMLESITGEKSNIDLEKLREDEYAWLQRIDGVPRQAFTDDELLVFNLFPSSDIEHGGYPVTPIDTAVSSITTHISIDTYKKLYFQNGRASRGMLVIQSDEVDQQLLDGIKLQYNAAINNVSNSFRTPIFGVGKEDNINWISMSGEQPDNSFEYMYDQVARNILSSFGVSPDELPGYGHLSRGTSSQTISESSNEYKLTASRDSGLRPLILRLQIFINDKLFPIIDPLLSKICTIRLAGLDAQNKDQEAARLQQDSTLHMTYDELLDEVDKESVGEHIGGKFPFNERFQIIADKFLSVGELKSTFFKDSSALIDPLLKYKRDPFYLQFLQLMTTVSPSTVKAYFSPRPFALELLKMNITDHIEEEDV